MTNQIRWMLPALGATALYGLMQICFRGLGEGQISAEIVYLLVFGLSWVYYRFELSKIQVVSIDSASVLVAASLCAAANFVAYFAVKAAPNPGYAVALFGLQAIIALIAGVTQHGAKAISGAQVFGAILTVGGAALISAFGEAGEHAIVTPVHSNLWIIYSALAAFLFAIEFMAFKKVQDKYKQVGVSDYALAAREAIWRWVTVIYLVAFLITGAEINVSPMMVLLILGATACSCVANILSFNALSFAPNLGLLLAIYATQAILVALGSVVIFGSMLTTLGLFGMIPCVAGVVLLSKPKKGAGV